MRDIPESLGWASVSLGLTMNNVEEPIGGLRIYELTKIVRDLQIA